MNSCYIFLDESGDLGWKFDSPYRRGGSSRYLTIASLIVPPGKKDKPKRIIRKLYQKFKWDTATERKWSDMSLNERCYFAERVKKLKQENPDIKLTSITVKKDRVLPHIRSDSNKLYNYMIQLLLVDEMSKYDEVTFCYDQRSIKVESGNSLHDYLVTKLWFEKEVNTKVISLPCNSANYKNIQFADMISGIVQGHFEDNNSKPWGRISTSLQLQKLFF